LEKRKVLRGSFEDICTALEELRRRIYTASWEELEGLYDRAFCGFMTPRLENFLRQIRLLGLEDDENVRWALLKIIENEKNWALRRGFELSGEYRIGRIREEP